MERIDETRAREMFGDAPFVATKEEGLVIIALFLGGHPDEPILCADVDDWRPTPPEGTRPPTPDNEQLAVWCPEAECWDLQ